MPLTKRNNKADEKQNISKEISLEPTPFMHPNELFVKSIHSDTALLNNAVKSLFINALNKERQTISKEFANAANALKLAYKHNPNSYIVDKEKIQKEVENALEDLKQLGLQFQREKAKAKILSEEDSNEAEENKV